MTRINKSHFIEEWWDERLKSGSQLVGDYRSGVRPLARKWKTRVATELLWSDFTDWLEEKHAWLAPMFTKVGFFTVFYRVTGSNACLMRQGRDNRIPAAKFMTLKEHRDARKQARGVLENSELVEQSDC